MKKVGICTVYTGFNYGSSLQALATKYILSQIGYSGEIIKLGGSIVPGRDVRIKKIIMLCFNLLLHLPQAKKTVRSYVGDDNAELSFASRELFDSFCEQYIRPLIVMESQLRRSASGDDYAAFICGSDQVWNASTFYVDPFYYLRFAPEKKRIAFAPSFGRDFIPDHNKSIIKKMIENIPYLSVREHSGKELIRELTGRDAEVLVDPTLAISKSAWCGLLDLKPSEKKSPYVLAYFLDSPSSKAKKALERLSGEGYRILSLPYERQDTWFDECIDAGPREFVRYVLDADIVCTDSFHGTAFSVNFGKTFYTFKRQYGSAADQSSRITSFLNTVGLMSRYDPDEINSYESIDFTKCEDVLEKERLRSVDFLKNALSGKEDDSE